MDTIKQDDKGRFVIPPDMIGVRESKMEIKDVVPCSHHLVITNEGEYRRLFKNNWEQLMGMSWEPVLYVEDEKFLENLFQEYMRNNDGL